MKKYIKRSFSFDEYFALLNRLSSDGKTTGPDQSESMVSYGQLNLARMRRLAKTTELDEVVRTKIGALDVDWIWLVITEGWCGDAAQNIPVIEKIAAANEGIETRYLLRDENPELMDRFLTNGTRSIPKLIAIDRVSGDVLGNWGPRPRVAQNLFAEQKSQGIEKPLILENIQRWYLADRGRSLQKEMAGLATQWARPQLAKAA
jgi:thioredoxin family protein